MDIVLGLGYPGKSTVFTVFSVFSGVRSYRVYTFIPINK